VSYFNDSKATNVDSALKAIEAFDQKLVVILGGKDKGGDFSPLREPLRQRARRTLLIGAASEKIATQLEGAVKFETLETLPQAVARAAEIAEPGDVILLAPACASFDQFESFEHRGRCFKEEVHRRVSVRQES
jgi:UDP-N-acetylmuramoylalanine--D-glutamate ligase